MSSVYVVSEHFLLGSKSKALLAKNEDEFAEQVALAADLLGVSETTYTGDALARINRAVVLQLEYQLKLGLDPFIYRAASSERSKQAVQYRGGDDGPPLTLAQAVAIVDSVNAETGDDIGKWGNIKSVR